MQCVKCIYREFFAYWCNILKNYAKNLGSVISLKLKAVKLIILRHIFGARKFHSPLMPLALRMIETAQARFPFWDRPHLKCVSETFSCLVDVAEKVTLCNRQNGTLKVYDYGKYAITFFDSQTLDGIRVFVDFKKLAVYSGTLHKYFTKTVDPHDLDEYDIWFEAILKADKIISVMPVKMNESFKGRGTGKKRWGICSKCREAGHLAENVANEGRPNGGDICISCLKADIYSVN